MYAVQNLNLNLLQGCANFEKSVLHSCDTPVVLNYNPENDLFGLKKSGKNRGISLFSGAQQPYIDKVHLQTKAMSN